MPDTVAGVLELVPPLAQPYATSPIARATKIAATATGRIGRLDPFLTLTFTGDRRPDLDLTLAPLPVALVRVWLGTGIDRIPTYPFWPRPAAIASDLTGP